MSYVLHVTPETFEAEVVRSSKPVVLDFWGPRCIPCIQLDPFMEALGEELDGRVKIVKIIAPEARKLCVELGVMGLPTFLAFTRGEEVHRITGNVTREAIREMAEALVADAG